MLIGRWKKQLVGAAVFGAILIAGSLSNPRQLLAQAVKAVIIRDQDEHARGAFQTTVNLDSSKGTNFVNVPVPAGTRLVVDYVTVSGAAASPNGNIQPYIILESTLNAGGSANYYLTQTQSPLTATQFSSQQHVTIAADSLNVAFAYSGFAPTSPGFAVWNVAISGHLISMP